MLAFYLSMLDDPEDVQTFTQFYNNYKGLMYQVAFRVLNDAYLAEDAVQESFKDMLGMVEKLRGMGEKQAKGFAATVVRNKAVDLWRKRKSMVSLDDVSEGFLSTEMEVDDSTHFFNQLPLRYSQVLRLVGLGFKPAEIAEILHRDVGTVYKQIARGKKLLGEIMEKEGYRL